jgi:thiosulfate/3-mercaptopyruvate sulfurtransferase
VLYDSVERDGGATASYVFWVLDLLGHEKKKILEGGIDAWTTAGGKVAPEPKKLESMFYQAPSDEKLIAEAVRMPWGSFRYNDSHRNTCLHKRPR